MSGAFPVDVIPSSVLLGSNSPTEVSMSQSGKRNTKQLGGHKWQITATFRGPYTRDQFMPVFAFLLEQEGQFESFTFIPPDLATPRGAASGTPLVNGASQVGKSVITDGWTPSTLVLRQGDVFKFAGHSKVYMTTAEATSDVSGNLTIQINTPLAESPANNEALVVADVPFTMHLTSDISEYNLSKPILYNFSIKMLEDL